MSGAIGFWSSGCAIETNVFGARASAFDVESNLLDEESSMLEVELDERDMKDGLLDDVARVREMAILMAMKRVSVAEAKNHLPALLHEAESEPVEIVRRGKPIAVLVSRAAFDRLEGRASFGAAIARFREKHGADVEELGQGIADGLCAIRDRDRGRNVRL